MQHKLDNFLFNYRNTPSSVTRKSPAELMFRQIPRTQLNLMKPKYLEGKSERRYTEVTTERENKSRRTLRNYVEGESVLVYLAYTKKWVTGKIMKCLSNCTYLVQVANKIRFIHADCLKSTTLGSDSLTEPLVPVTQTEYRPVSNFDGTNPVQDPPETLRRILALQIPRYPNPKLPWPKHLTIAHRPKRTINAAKRLDF
ncbi:hypothetical protein QE152_g27733 [Popillia japonica]|uniref:Uncharacterized protein n=1 Tax=Popillia japonica TaxID=7064 RepID=A0AAW1JV93_POPJA